MKDNRNFGIWSTRPAISKKESAPLFKGYHLSHISCWFELEKAARTSAHKTAAKPNICSHWARKKTSAHMAAKPNVCCFSSLVLTDSFEHKMPGLHNFRIHQYQVFIWLSTNVVKYKFCNSEIFSS